MGRSYAHASRPPTQPPARPPAAAAPRARLKQHIREQELGAVELLKQFRLENAKEISKLRQEFELQVWGSRRQGGAAGRREKGPCRGLELPAALGLGACEF